MNHEYPTIVEALEREPSDDFIADGEIVAFENGITSFSRLQRRGRERVPVFLYLFDLPRHAGEDLAQRAAAPAQGSPPAGARVRRPGPLQPSPQRRARRGAVPRGVREGPRGSDRQACRQPVPERRPLARLAQAEVPRRAGARDRRLHRAEGLSHGVRRAARGLLRRRRDASLRRQGRHRLRPAHAAGARRAHARARAGRVAHSSRFKPIPPGTHWVRPELVAQIGFAEWTRDGRLRHPRYLGLRDDKPAREVVRELPS